MQVPSPDLAHRKGYHHGNLEQALIEAARRLVAEKGPAGFTLADAARLAGVTPAAVYRHFADKFALLGALSAQGFSAFGEALEAPLARDREAGAALADMGSAYLAFARTEPGYYNAMFAGGLTKAEPGNGKTRAFDALTTAIAAIAPLDETQVHGLALKIWALSHGVVMLETIGLFASDGGVPAAEAMLRDGVSALIAGATGTPFQLIP